jgi:hypothetical protein
MFPALSICLANETLNLLSARKSSASFLRIHAPFRLAHFATLFSHLRERHLSDKSDRRSSTFFQVPYDPVQASKPIVDIDLSSMEDCRAWDTCAKRLLYEVQRKALTMLRNLVLNS